MKPSQILIRARRILAGHLTFNELYDERNGTYCAIGALSAATQKSGEAFYIDEIPDNQIPEGYLQAMKHLAGYLETPSRAVAFDSHKDRVRAAHLTNQSRIIDWFDDLDEKDIDEAERIVLKRFDGAIARAQRRERKIEEKNTKLTPQPKRDKIPVA